MPHFRIGPKRFYNNNYSGAIVKAFTCRACGNLSRVNMVIHDAKQTFLVCEHCKAQHTITKIPTPNSELPEVQAGPLRECPPDQRKASG